MERVLNKGLLTRPWAVSFKSLACGIGALSAVAFATPAQAAATYSGLTQISVFATAPNQGVLASAVGQNDLLFATAAGNAFSSASISGSVNGYLDTDPSTIPPDVIPLPGDPVDILLTFFELTAEVFGTASQPFGDVFSQSASQSFNSFTITLTNNSANAVTVDLGFNWSQAISAGTNFLNEAASATSNLLVTDEGGGTVLESLLAVVASDGTSDSALAADLTTVLVSLAAGASTVFNGILVDTFGTADAIPEPGSMALLLAGLAGLGFARRRSLKF